MLGGEGFFARKVLYSKRHSRQLVLELLTQTHQPEADWQDRHAAGRRCLILPPLDFYDLSPTTQSIVGYFRIFGKDLQGFRPN
jgi:hypothetical protein